MNKAFRIAAAGLILATGMGCSIGGTSMRAIENNGLIVSYDPQSGVASLSRKGAPLLSDIRLPGAGPARAGEVADNLGKGITLTIEHPSGDATILSLYDSLPFLIVRAELRNTGREPRVVENLVGLSASLNLRRPPAEIRTLSCEGASSAEGDKASYSFLAFSDPETRVGIVSGWLTHNRGSGIVFSKQSGDSLAITNRCEYGKLRLAPGQAEKGELFAIGGFDDAFDGLEALADAIAKANNITLPPAPSGYCTWYHAGCLDEIRMALLAEFCDANLKKFGFDFLQIDDQWQLSGRDYTTHHPTGAYRSGMKSTADKIASGGFRAGIWFIPFGWDPNCPALKEHHDWFVKRPDGSIYEVYWAGSCLDMTNPQAREFLRCVISRMTKEWGYKYIKIDGLWSGMATKILYPEPNYRDDELGQAVLHDPSKTQIEAYRDGLRLVREAAGDDVFILGCNIAQNMRTLGASFGLVDGMRVGRDIGADWGAILNCAGISSHLYFLNGRVWRNDPDCLMLRKPLTLDQARAWGSWIAISGQMNVVSEWLPGLPADKLDVVKRTMPNHQRCARPVDLFTSKIPQIWHLPPASGSARHVVGLFNWDERKETRIELKTADLGHPSGDDRYVGFDFWENKFVPPFSKSLRIGLRPASCRVISLVPLADHPQVVGTSRHVTQGAVDLIEEKWEANSLSGISRVVGGDSYEIRIHAPSAPAQWRVAGVSVSAEDSAAGVKISFKQNDSWIRVTIESGQSRNVAWKADFAK
ncbi:MAG TPA: alpha-galactosidase [Candidatus Brocadiia bacterium]|nr:alpha-galactosidase [Candidatus Brocadiia bacterium]